MQVGSMVNGNLVKVTLTVYTDQFRKAFKFSKDELTSKLKSLLEPSKGSRATFFFKMTLRDLRLEHLMDKRTPKQPSKLNRPKIPQQLRRLGGIKLNLKLDIDGIDLQSMSSKLKAKRASEAEDAPEDSRAMLKDLKLRFEPFESKLEVLMPAR